MTGEREAGEVEETVDGCVGPVDCEMKSGRDGRILGFKKTLENEPVTCNHILVSSAKVLNHTIKLVDDLLPSG